MRTITRSRLRAIALVVVAAPLLIAATAAAGSQPAELTSIPDAAFRPVSVPPLSGASAAPAPAAVAPPAAAPAPGRSPDLSELRDLAFPTDAPPRAQPSLDAAKAIVIPIPTPTPKPPKPPATTRSIRGYASYYCWAGSSPCTVNYPDGGGFDAYAAAGPRLRAAIGSGWRGSIVYVDGVRVKLIDWCQCYEGQSNEKLLDLYHDVFARTGSPVVIRW